LDTSPTTISDIARKYHTLYRSHEGRLDLKGPRVLQDLKDRLEMLDPRGQTGRKDRKVIRDRKGLREFLTEFSQPVVVAAPQGASHFSLPRRP